MKNLHFKTPFYRLYSPIFFKFRKFYALLLASCWKTNPDQTKNLISYCWDRYLAKKFYSEISYYPGNRFCFNKVKRNSDTLFILGCGASIEDLSSKDWDIIAQHDSIGVNYFYPHKFRPSFHMIELGQSKLSMDCLNKHLLSKSDRSDEGVFVQFRHILRRDDANLCNTHGNLSLYSPSVPKSTCIELIKNIVRRWYSKPKSLMHHASNLDCTVHFAYQMGYKNIYLLGVDLNNNQYFWDVTTEKNEAIADVKSAVADDYKISNFNTDPKAVHATADKGKAANNKALTIIEYLTIVDRDIFKKEGVSFATCSPNSLLRKHFNYIALDSIT